MLKFLKVTSAPKAIALGCQLPPKPCTKRLVLPKKEEPSCDANLFSKQLWKLYDSSHYLMEGSSRQKAFHTDPDTHQPSSASSPGRCTMCRYVSKSEHDNAVHNRLRHPKSGSLLNK